jgi:Transposase DDE domain
VGFLDRLWNAIGEVQFSDMPGSGTDPEDARKRAQAIAPFLARPGRARLRPTKYWLSNVARTISFRELVDIAKLRWRIERDYQDLKQEIGLGHYEGRAWRGFHHHGTLCIAAYGFLIFEQETISPSAPRSAGMFAKPAISAGYRPRGAAAPAPTARPQLNRDHPLRNGGRDRPDAALPSCARRFPRNMRRNL